MPLPRALARFNRRVTNRVLWPIVSWLPGFGRVVHVGRRTGHRYRTPMLAFRRGETFTFALAYGSHADWTRNVLAAGGCRFETRSGVTFLVEPRLYRDPRRAAVPLPARLGLRLLRADRFMTLRTIPNRSAIGENL